MLNNLFSNLNCTRPAADIHTFQSGPSAVLSLLPVPPVVPSGAG